MVVRCKYRNQTKKKNAKDANSCNNIERKVQVLEIKMLKLKGISGTLLYYVLLIIREEDMHMAIVTNVTEKNYYDENGVLIKREEEVQKTNFKKNNDEGEYIKVYFSDIRKLCSLSANAVALLIELASRMSYANTTDDENFGGQIVTVRKDIRDAICAELSIQTRAYYYNIKKLKEEKFIKEVSKSTYQINPSIIGRGLFEYSPKFKYGGIKDLREIFDKDVKTETTVTDDTATIGLIEQEIEKYVEIYQNETDNWTKQAMAKDIREMREELKKLSDMNYSKTTKFTQKQQKMFDGKAKALYDKVEDLIEDARIDLDEE